jgi:membrane protein DedA with SNARE-associated domain
MTEFIIRTIELGGLLGIFVLMALENIFPPLPSEIIMGLGGVAVARGTMEYWPLLLVGSAGTTLGNYWWYWICDRWGRTRLEPFVTRHGRWLTMEWHDVERARAFFRRHGSWVVFAMRFTPVLRTLISIPAGLSHMGAVRFLVYTFAGAFVWNLAMVELGRRLARSQELLGWLVLAIFVAAFGGYVWRVLTWKPRKRD